MMALEYNGTRVGAMQYNGVTIGEAMMDGQIVYRSSPYPATGTFEIVNGAAFDSHEVFSHTVVEPGNFTGTIVIESGQAAFLIWSVNGGSPTSGSEVTRTFTGLSVGDTIKLEAMSLSTLNLSGTWSVVKN